MVDRSARRTLLIASDLVRGLLILSIPIAVPLPAAQQLIGHAFLAAYAIHSISVREWVLPASELGRPNAIFL